MCELVHLIATVALSASVLADTLHPLVKLENIYPSNDVELKISAMTCMSQF